MLRKAMLKRVFVTTMLCGLFMPAVGVAAQGDATVDMGAIEQAQGLLEDVQSEAQNAAKTKEEWDAILYDEKLDASINSYAAVPSVCPPSLQNKINTARNEAPNHTQIVLFASHHTTGGASSNGYTEEMWAKDMVPKAVNILRNRGYRNIVLAGTEGSGTTSENEYDVSYLCFNDNTKRVIMTNHLNSGPTAAGAPAMLIYGNYSPAVNTVHTNFANILSRGGITYKGKVFDADYRILKRGDANDKSDRYLLEWANIRSVKELSWARDTNARANDLANLVEASFGSQMYNVNTAAIPDQVGLAPVYRVYNPNSGEHLFTPNYAEVEVLRKAGWRPEGKAWSASTTKPMLKVFRLYNPNAGDHFYTADTNEFAHLLRVGWKDDKYIIPANNQGLAVYRLYNPNAKTGTHHYTLDSNERDALRKAGWRYEGIAFYAETL